MPLDGEGTTTVDELLNKVFPELIASVEAPHHCIYRDLLGKFVAEDLLKQSTDRLEGTVLIFLIS